MSLPAPQGQTNVTLRVGYPDSMDQSDVIDQYAYQQLATQGIHVIPTFYDALPLAYKGLLAGQQDLAWPGTTQNFALGPGINHEQTTCFYNGALAGVFLSIVGHGITDPKQMVGFTSEDFGPGAPTRALNYYWYATSGIATNTNGPSPNSVYLKPGGGNPQRIRDLETNVTQAIVLDDFALANFQDPSVNNTAHNGPFHVLFYAPTGYLDNCWSARDDWLSNPQNQHVVVQFIAALISAQRHFISNIDQLLPFAQQQLPLTPVSEVQFTAQFYPSHYTYWPFGVLNLQGDQNLQAKFDFTNKFYEAAGLITTPVQNNTVQPFGVVNKYFELQALQMLGPYTYPKAPWVDQTFASNVKTWVPSWMGGISGQLAIAFPLQPELMIAIVNFASRMHVT
jgi:hypothetical protein